MNILISAPQTLLQVSFTRKTALHRSKLISAASPFKLHHLYLFMRNSVVAMNLNRHTIRQLSGVQLAGRARARHKTNELDRINTEKMWYFVCDLPWPTISDSIDFKAHC